MNPRGQVSLFLVLAGILLLLIVLVVTPEITQPSSPLDDTNREVISTFVEACIEQTASQALSLAKVQGGYTTLPEQSDFPAQTALYFDQGSLYIPSISAVEDQISTYVADNLHWCLNFSGLENQGYEIQHEFSTVSVSSQITQDELIIKLQTDLKATKQEIAHEFTEFTSTIQSDNFLQSFQISSEIAQAHLISPDAWCLNCISDIVESSGLISSVSSLDGQTSLIALHKPDESSLGAFRFGMRIIAYDCQNLPPEVDGDFFDDCLQEELDDRGYVFSVNQPPDMVVKVGELFVYEIQAQGLGLQYNSWSSLVSIDSTGRIEYIPTEEDIGTHLIAIDVYDSFGNSEQVSIPLEIIA